MNRYTLLILFVAGKAIKAVSEISSVSVYVTYMFYTEGSLVKFTVIALCITNYTDL